MSLHQGAIYRGDLGFTLSTVSLRWRIPMAACRLSRSFGALRPVSRSRTQTATGPAHERVQPGQRISRRQFNGEQAHGIDGWRASPPSEHRPSPSPREPSQRRNRAAATNRGRVDLSRFRFGRQTRGITAPKIFTPAQAENLCRLSATHLA